MGRLTKKNDYELTKNEYPYSGLALNSKIFEKLGKLEDLEDQIGMPLLDIFKYLNVETLYSVAYVHNTRVSEVVVKNVFGLGNKIYFELIGKEDCTDRWNTSVDKLCEYVFFTREEAEKKLEEMKD